jgi:hypothetical protein
VLSEGRVFVDRDAPDAAIREVVLPEDFVFREVREAEATPEGVMALMNEFGPLAAGDGYPVGVAIEALETLQALADAYLAYVRGDEVEFCRVIGVAESYAGAWSAWQAEVNDALRAFPMFIEVDPDYPWMRTSEAPEHTLYEAAVFQLATVAAEARDFHICANDNCGRPFTRHRSSRRRYGAESAHSAGIKYCSQNCAKAQSERERRRRRRAEKEA